MSNMKSGNHNGTQKSGVFHGKEDGVLTSVLGRKANNPNESEEYNMTEMVNLREGMDVFGADGDKLGSIDGVYSDYVSVKKGFFFPEDHYVPINAIQGVDEENKVWLSVTKDEALNQGWDRIPETGTTYTDLNAPYATSNAAGSYVGSELDASGRKADTRGVSGENFAGAGVDARGEVIDPNFVAEADPSMGSTDATRVPVYEEEITPVKQAVDRGKVRIEKEVVTENRTVTVPVTEERVRVTQVDTNEAVTGDTADAFHDGTIEVPLKGEEVSLEKTARKTGEVIVDKEAVQRDEQVSGEIRRENVRVDDQTRTTDSISDHRNKKNRKSA